MKRTNLHVYGERAFWVKGAEAEMVKARTLTVILRPGDRSDPVKAPQQWLPLLEPIPVYCIAIPGDQAKGISPQFEPDCGLTVKIVRRTVTRLCDIVGADLNFQMGGAVPFTSEEVLTYLEEVLSPGKKFAPEDLITVYWVEHLLDEAPATD